MEVKSLIKLTPHKFAGLAVDSKDEMIPNRNILEILARP
jgi:hypothetical protein